MVGVGLLTLLVTGLPWTGFWGAKVQSFATEQGSSMWSADPGALSDPTSTLDESLPHSHQQDVPWAQGELAGAADVPDRQDGERSVANVDTAITVADRQGLRHPMTVALPAPDDATGVFSVIGYAFDAPSDEQTVHVDRYGGEVVSTYGFADYPLLAKVVSQGIGLHEGRSLGLWSFWGSTLMCLAVIFMCVTGPLMWWRRRPTAAAQLGAPRGRMPLRASPLLRRGRSWRSACSCRCSGCRCWPCCCSTSWCCAACPPWRAGSAPPDSRSYTPDSPAHRLMGGVWGGVVRVRRSGRGTRGRVAVVPRRG